MAPSDAGTAVDAATTVLNAAPGPVGQYEFKLGALFGGQIDELGPHPPHEDRREGHRVGLHQVGDRLADDVFRQKTVAAEEEIHLEQLAGLLAGLGHIGEGEAILADIDDGAQDRFSGPENGKEISVQFEANRVSSSVFEVGLQHNSLPYVKLLIGP